MKIELNKQSFIKKLNMSLVVYNNKLELDAFGFNNLGATCYFNAMLQSLLSCTSFAENLLQNKDDDEYTKNPVTRKLVELIELALLMKSDDPNKQRLEENNTRIKNLLRDFSPEIWKSMVMCLCKKNNINIGEFMVGQQCAREGFHCLMDVMENLEDIQNIFLHRYKNMIHCFDCNKWVSDVESMYSLFEVQANLKTEQLDRFKKYDSIEIQDMNDFLIKQTGYVDKFYICPECKHGGEKYNINTLVMVPEVLVVLTKKYKTGSKLDIYTNFPKTLEFDKDGDSTLKYEAVSQIEHIGGMNGGHYWSISRRNGGWYKLDDNSVSESEFLPTKHTYIVFYHLIE
jgi:ubiquitin C-terminal hydrolase